MLEGLQNLLEAHDIQVTGMARDGMEAVKMVRQSNPDVILMDIRMPGCDGLAATRLIKAEMPEARIVILTTSTEDQDLFEAVKSGAYGYLLKSMDAGELIECLEQVQQGIPPFSSGLAAKLLGEFARLSAPAETVSAAPVEFSDGTAPGSSLTARQMEVLTLIAQGFSYKEAEPASIKSPTIKYHMAEIMQQLIYRTRPGMAYAGKMGFKGDKPDK
jgi:two-component system NarL family response regulator